jgi:hypothetical protein
MGYALEDEVEAQVDSFYFAAGEKGSQLGGARVELKQQVLDEVAKYFGDVSLADLHELVDELQALLHLPLNDVGSLLQPPLLQELRLLLPQNNGVNRKWDVQSVDESQHFVVDEQMREQFDGVDPQLIVFAAWGSTLAGLIHGGVDGVRGGVLAGVLDL